MPVTCYSWLITSLSLLHADAYRTCNCPRCAPFFEVPPSEDSLCTPLEPVQCAKYLGSYITPTSSSVPDVNFRCSQACSAFKTLDPFFRHPLISPKNKLPVYTQIVQAILLHGSESRARMNTCFPFHTLFFRLVFLHPFESQIPG